MSHARLTESLEEFRGLHRGAKAGTLGTADLATYHAIRDELARLLLSAQHIGLLAGQRPRRSLREARSLLVELEFCDGTERAMTLQLSSGGFAALLASAPQVGEEVKVSLCLPGGQPLQADARVVAVKRHLGNTSTSFQFVGLGGSEVERMEMFVFDALLEKFQEV
jgi:PilZ domain